MEPETHVVLAGLAHCDSLEALLASLYHLALQSNPDILLANGGEESAAGILKDERTYWRRQVGPSRLLDIDPRDLLNRISTRYGDSPRTRRRLGLYALLHVLDGCAGKESQTALLEVLAHPCRIPPSIGAAEYLVLPRPTNPLFNRLESLPAAQAFRADSEVAPQVGDFLRCLLFAETRPGRLVRLAMPSAPLSHLLKRRAEDLRIAVFPLSDDLEFDFTGAPAEGDWVRYRFVRIRNEESVWAQVRAILEHCREQSIAIAVFPELTITPSLESRMQDWLAQENRDFRLLLVVAGSFHRVDLSDNDLPVNACRVLQFDGNVVFGTDAATVGTRWVHRKLNPYQVLSRDLEGLRRSPDAARFARFLALFPSPGHQGIEDISPGTELLLFDLPVGRAAVGICLDLLVEPDIRILQDFGATLVFVPAMSPTVERFQATSKRLGGSWRTAVFCANSAWIVPKGREGRGSSFIYLPVHKGLYPMYPPSDLPAFIRREAGGLIFDCSRVLPPAEGPG